MKNYIPYFFILILAIGCTEERDFPFNESVPLPVTLEHQELNENGVTLHAKLLSRGNQAVESYGFIWETNGLTFRKSFTENYGGSFSYRITSDLKRGQQIEYRAFVKTARTTYLGEARYFMAQGATKPVITGVQPLSAARGEKVTVVANHLSNIKNRNLVLVNRRSVETVQTSDNTLLFTVPENLTGTNIELQVKSGELTSDIFEGLRLDGPLITSVSASSARPMDVITVYAPEFGTPKGTTYVTLEGFVAQILEEGPGFAKIAVPDLTGTYKLWLVIDGVMGNPALAPSITVSQLWEDAGSVDGSFWAPTWFEYKNDLYQTSPNNDQIAKLNLNSLTLSPVATMIPSYIQWFLPGTDALYRIWVDAEENYHLSHLDLESGEESFIKFLDTQLKSATLIKAVTIGNTAYIVSQEKLAYKLNLSTYTLERMSDLPEANYYLHPYVDGGTLYVYTPNNTYVYNDASDTWEIHSENTGLDESVYSIFRHNNQLFKFTSRGMYRWYDEYEKWAFIKSAFGPANVHYDNNGLHVIGNSNIKRMLN